MKKLGFIVLLLICIIPRTLCFVMGVVAWILLDGFMMGFNEVNEFNDEMRGTPLGKPL